jgi:SAM-dependent methyltransferase
VTMPPPRARDAPPGQPGNFAPIGAGRCALCGYVGEYLRTEAPTRETHECRGCGASLRYRLQARAIAATCGDPDLSLAKLVEQPSFRGLAIYEPGIIGPFRRLLRDLPGYVNSYYWPDVEPGAERDGVRCEDLRDLTFPDESFDLVVSSDIFEHVRGPMRGFAEIFRVLRPGGHHIFTVPLTWPLPGTTEARVDYSGPEDVHLVPPEYHGSPTDPRGSLVYTDFGMDLPEQLRELGFETSTRHGYRHAITFVSWKPPQRDL